MTRLQQQVLSQIRLELAEVGCELSCTELESMRQFLILLDAAGSSEGLQNTLDRLAPTWHGGSSYSLLESPAGSHQQATI
jgi:hypothetical protein